MSSENCFSSAHVSSPSSPPKFMCLLCVFTFQCRSLLLKATSSTSSPRELRATVRHLKVLKAAFRINLKPDGILPPLWNAHCETCCNGFVTRERVFKQFGNLERKVSKSAQGSWSTPSFLSLSGLGSGPPTAKHRQYKNRKWCTGKKRSPPAWACLYCSHCNAPEMHPSITPVSSVAGNRSYCWCHIPLSLTIKWLVTAYHWMTNTGFKLFSAKSHDRL